MNDGDYDEAMGLFTAYAITRLALGRDAANRLMASAAQSRSTPGFDGPAIRKLYRKFAVEFHAAIRTEVAMRDVLAKWGERFADLGMPVREPKVSYVPRVLPGSSGRGIDPDVGFAPEAVLTRFTDALFQGLWAGSNLVMPRPDANN